MGEGGDVASVEGGEEELNNVGLGTLHTNSQSSSMILC